MLMDVVCKLHFAMNDPFDCKNSFDCVLICCRDLKTNLAGILHPPDSFVIKQTTKKSTATLASAQTSSSV